jgi:hypothetical protein
MRFSPDGVLVEKPLGLCPHCGNMVYASEEIDGVFEKRIAWVCASDLDPEHVYYQASDVTPEEMQQAWHDTHCPKAYGRTCSRAHFPLHQQCYYRRAGVHNKISYDA